MAAREKRDFTEILIRGRVITPDQLAEAKRKAAQQGVKLADALVKLDMANAEQVTRALAQQFGLDYVNLSEVAIPASVIDVVPESVARDNCILPLAAEDGQLTVIVSDPEQFELFDKLRFILNRQISVALAPREAILEGIKRCYGRVAGPDGMSTKMQEVQDEMPDFSEASITESLGDEAVDEASAPIVKLVHLIISEAVQLRASDIHVEPFEDRVRVRYRIDGVLMERDSVPKRFMGALISRFKILAKLDIAERRRTQDGRIKVTLGKKELDLRVSVIPTNFGQSVVCRLLDKDSIRVSVKQLGFADDEYKKFQGLIRRPNGIVLVTGPTGSGKTTTLYAALNELNTPDRKIITAEDPVEYYLPGINQVEIRHDIGLDFARVIRAMLRQAPNIILVGEMRDLETAQMGIQASLTGHLVFSTLHTNDAPSAVTRLVDMGVPSYLVSSSVIAIMAQRLVRVICQKCKQPNTPPQAALDAAGITPEMVARAKFARGRGCPACQKTGFRGRTGIYELMLMTPKVRDLTFHEASTDDLRRAAISDGMRTLYWDGINKVLRGVTTVEEVLETAKRTDAD